ncbi:MAG: aminotransferase class V-fold PLP-dependent enzyme, partial [Immundisolibacteraceae bacterium]|nr:aminotransferase class V-fold PLP-dependent enzyme [Immundisolibacteraceae bacterium]
MHNSWLFAADRGGTFTDLVGIAPDGQIHSRKLRSESPAYPDAAIAGIRQLLELGDSEPIPADQISSIRIGTTVATNALLERKGEATALLITRGFGDLLEIGNQSRPDIFALSIEKPEQLYQQVAEVTERLDATGEVITNLDEQPIIDQLNQWQQQGIRAIAVALMHGWVNSVHELRLGELAANAGFKQISLSHQCMRLIKLVNRAQTTLVDAYLSPVLLRYVNQLQQTLGDIPLEFMQSSGGLTDASAFTGKEAVLSGPAGGVVAVAQLASPDHPQLIGFDMGGTSTDVCRYGGEFEYRHEVTTAGIAYHANMLQIETVAAGGGSILGFDGQRMTVGPESAGANPGPVCYGQGGPLTITDANLVLGRLLQVTFPRQFGADQQSSIDAGASRKALLSRTEQINRATGDNLSVEQVALGYLQIANQQMAKPIRSVSVARGYDLRDHALVSFGGAGGLHAGELATILGINKLLIDPLAGIFSAWGIATAPRRHESERSLLLAFNSATLSQLDHQFDQLADGLYPLFDAARPADNQPQRRDLLDLRPQGSDSYLTVSRADYPSSCAEFSNLFHQHYGYRVDTDRLELVNIRVEITQAGTASAASQYQASHYPFELPETTAVFLNDQWQSLPCIALSSVKPNKTLPTPSLVISDQFTLLIDQQFDAVGESSGGIQLTRKAAPASPSETRQSKQQPSKADPITLEIYHHRFMGIAEQMGVTLQNTAHSVNMKERLDFSCALFDQRGNLVAGGALVATEEVGAHRAPRPIIGHLDPQFVGMMDEVKALLQYAFQTKNELTIPVSAPGSAGMETCFTNLVEPGDTVVVCQNGVFGMRMAENVTRCGGKLVLVEDGWGTAVDPQKLEDALIKNPEAKLVAFVHAETSTGVESDAKTLCAVAHKYDCLTIVDAVTSLGGIELDVDGWGIDAIYSGTQKCLSAPPGISPVSFNDKAVEMIKARKTPVQSWFLDLNLVMGYWGQGAKRAYHHTAPINALYALHESLLLLREEGLENAWARHKHHHNALKAGLEAMGLTFVVDEAVRLPQLNAVAMPEGVDE